MSAIAEAFTQAVPMARTLGLVIESVDATGAIAVMAEDERFHNHVAAPHAGVIFTVGELTSGIAVTGAFIDHLDRAVPLAVRAEIAYRKLTRGTIRATARLGRPAADVVAELDAGKRPEFDVNVEIATGDGTVTAELLVVWTLKPHRA